MLTLQSLYVLATETAIVTSTVALLFLPAIIELKKPKDSGPRLLNDSLAKIRISALQTALTNIEEDDNSQTITLASFLYQLPNLEV